MKFAKTRWDVISDLKFPCESTALDAYRKVPFRPRFQLSTRLHVWDKFLQWILDHHGTNATSISATVFSALISNTDIESGIARCPSSQLLFVDIGKTMAVLPASSVSISRFGLFLCMFLGLRNCLNLSDTNVTIGRREGRHANDDSNSLDVS